MQQNGQEISQDEIYCWQKCHKQENWFRISQIWKQGRNFQKKKNPPSHSRPPKMGLQVKGLVLAFHPFFITQERTSMPKQLTSYPGLCWETEPKQTSRWVIEERDCVCAEKEQNLARKIDKMLESRFHYWLRLGPVLFPGVWIFFKTAFLFRLYYLQTFKLNLTLFFLLMFGLFSYLAPRIL